MTTKDGPGVGAPAGTRSARPYVAALEAFVAAYVVLTVAMIGLGVLIDRLGGVRHWDVVVNRWFVRHRTGSFNTATAIGSHLAETVTVIALGLLIVLVLRRLHDRWGITFLAVALGLEVSVFLTVTLFVDRHRPPVPKLDTAPPTSSFPSGHTAAAVALYVGVVVLLSRRTRSPVHRAALVAASLVIPAVVGLSRLYRGMHHPTDIFAGVLLGVACLIIASVTATAVESRRGPDGSTILSGAGAEGRRPEEPNDRSGAVMAS